MNCKCFCFKEFVNLIRLREYKLEVIWKLWGWRVLLSNTPFGAVSEIQTYYHYFWWNVFKSSQQLFFCLPALLKLCLDLSFWATISPSRESKLEWRLLYIAYSLKSDGNDVAEMRSIALSKGWHVALSWWSVEILVGQCWMKGEWSSPQPVFNKHWHHLLYSINRKIL